MKTLITSMAVAMLFAVTANAGVIHFTDYEADGASQGTGFGIQPASMDFTDGGGDFIGQPGLGLSSANASSGSFAYAIDAETSGNILNNGNGWGGNWSGIGSDSANASGGLNGTAASVMAAGSGSYINYAAGATFTVSAAVATDATNPASGGIVTQPRLEFFDAAGNELFRNDAGVPQTPTTLTTAFQTISHSYTLTAADIAAGVVRVNAVIGADGLGFDQSGAIDAGPLAGGIVYYDDFLFEVDDAFIVTVVPEPSTASLLIAGLMGFCGVRRRRS